MDRWQRVTSATFTIAVTVMAVGIAYQAFGSGKNRVRRGSSSLDFVPSWQKALAYGSREGPVDAPVTIVELADLECPACRAFETTLDAVRGNHTADLAVVWVNFPLSYHRFALGAARAAVCAGRIDAASRWRRAVFAKQDSLGLKSWGAFAAAAGIKDTAAISACARDPAPVNEIQSGLKFGSDIHMTGTPTVIVNGWRFSDVPDSAGLEAVIAAELHGRRPPGAEGGID